jgi:hypothetical protein
VADGDVVVAEDNVAHDEPDDLSALLDREPLGVGCQPGAEGIERLGELEVGLGVAQLAVEGTGTLFAMSRASCFASFVVAGGAAVSLAMDLRSGCAPAAVVAVRPG